MKPLRYDAPCSYSAYISFSRLDSKSGSMCSSAVASPTSPQSPRSPPSPPHSPDPELANSMARKQSSYTSFQNAVLTGIQNLLPVASGEPIIDVFILSSLVSSLYHLWYLHRIIFGIFIVSSLVYWNFLRIFADVQSQKLTAPKISLVI